ncbi:hypothetical protein ACV3J7_07315 [Salmonella enterica]
MSRPIWSVEPDWSEDVTESLSWKTDVLTSPSGAEQRIARRLSPRRTFEFTAFAAGAGRRALENLLYVAGATEWDLPVFPDVAILSVSLAAGATFIPVETVGRDFIAGDRVLIKSGFGALAASESPTVITVQAAGLVISATATAWPAGSLVYPLRPAVLTDPPQLKRHTDNHSSAECRFRLAAHNPTTANAGAVSWRGHPVLVLEPDWAEDVTGEYERLLAELDNQTGIPSRTDTAGRAFAVQSLSWSAAGRAVQSGIRSLLYYLRGRQRAVWVPGSTTDFIPLAASGNALTVERAGFCEYGVNPGRRDLCLRLADGSRVYRRILSAALITGGERLELDDVAPQVAQIVQISFMTLSRLNSDDVTWKHITDASGCASVAVIFRGVRDELE